ncbi:hypothetical protein BpHYR1_018134 [Brachionus plicatilis]|uniref:Uncharacterized protein n=1 Tax=Brachionus plicatilis TaxID=10195 RepID=A0A3M7RKF3_BRAPC|nr:hypothetical protein BpHYR1_018134 [Brachionus plicatilis]
MIKIFVKFSLSFHLFRKICIDYDHLRHSNCKLQFFKFFFSFLSKIEQNENEQNFYFANLRLILKYLREIILKSTQTLMEDVKSWIGKI